MPQYEVGHSRRTVAIGDGWRVLDVGSGRYPHPRANCLLEKFMTDHRHRSGEDVAADSRLIIGDALAMPFADKEFDFVIASHIAEHVPDPAALCRELVRVAHAGYVETPGWLADMLLREEFHLWRVRRRGHGLRFDDASTARSLGSVADVFYGLYYALHVRPGRRTYTSDRPIVRFALRAVRKVLAKAIRLPGARRLMFTQLEWSGSFPVWVNGRRMGG